MNAFGEKCSCIYLARKTPCAHKLALTCVNRRRNKCLLVRTCDIFSCVYNLKVIYGLDIFDIDLLYEGSSLYAHM